MPGSISSSPAGWPASSALERRSPGFAGGRSGAPRSPCLVPSHIRNISHGKNGSAPVSGFAYPGAISTTERWPPDRASANAPLILFPCLPRANGPRQRRAFGATPTGAAGRAHAGWRFLPRALRAPRFSFRGRRRLRFFCRGRQTARARGAPHDCPVQHSASSIWLGMWSVLSGGLWRSRIDLRCMRLARTRRAKVSSPSTADCAAWAMRSRR